MSINTLHKGDDDDDNNNNNNNETNLVLNLCVNETVSGLSLLTNFLINILEKLDIFLASSRFWLKNMYCFICGGNL